MYGWDFNLFKILRGYGWDLTLLKMLKLGTAKVWCGSSIFIKQKLGMAGILIYLKC